MEIGGHDVEIEIGEHREGVIERAMSAALSIWTNGVTERDSDENTVFVYRDVRAKESWDAYGWDETNCSDMIMMSVEENHLCCVMEDPKAPESKKILDAVRAAIREF